MANKQDSEINQPSGYALPAPQWMEVLPGVTLAYTQTDRFKVGYFALTVSVPLCKAETAARTLLFKVLSRGTEKLPTIDLVNCRLDELYATPYRVIHSRPADEQILGFGAEPLDAAYIPDGMDVLGGIMEIMTDMFFAPARDKSVPGEPFFARSVALEKKNVIDTLRADGNVPSVYAFKRFKELFYRDEAWGFDLRGTESEIEAVEPAALTDLWRRILLEQPLQATYIGSMDGQTVAAKLRPYFERYSACLPKKSTGENELSPAACVSKASGEVLSVEETYHALQGQLFMGYRTGIHLAHPLFYAMSVCHELLGVSPTNRLFIYVREALGVCYSIGSDYDIVSGDVVVRCGVDAKNRVRTQEAIEMQIRALQTGDFSDAELEAARKSLILGYLTVNDSTTSYARYWNLRMRFASLKEQSPSLCIERYRAVTREQVIEAANCIKLDTVYFLAGKESKMNGSAKEEGEEHTADASARGDERITKA